MQWLGRILPSAGGDLVVPAGVYVYALTFTLLDLVNERLGRTGARQVIATAFCANLLLAGYAQLTVWAPAPAFFDGQAAVARVLGATPRIVFASLVAYLVSALIDAEVFAWWRARVGGFRWLRVLVSNAVSTGLDSILFVTLAFAGILPLAALIVGQYLVKMAVTLVSLPLIYWVRATAGAAALDGSAGEGAGRRPGREDCCDDDAYRGAAPRARPRHLGLRGGSGAGGARVRIPGALPDGPSAAERARPGVVAIRARVPADRPSVATLGEERAGSATLIAPDGLAVTVGYLVLEAAEVEARLADGRRTTARVLGHDFESGLALIRLDGAGAPYPVVPVGRSATVAPGQAVAVVGVGESRQAAGLPARVQAVRSFVAYWEYLLERALLVAPHHPAFGGAAVVDQDGALVGVVSLRLADGHMAIPIDLLGPVQEAVVRTGRPARAPRPWLGIRAVGIEGGVGVAGVSPVGPAHTAGLRAGDVIVRVDGERVADVEAFYRKLWGRAVGGPLELVVYREGQLETLTVRPQDRYSIFQFRSP